MRECICQAAKALFLESAMSLFAVCADGGAVHIHPNVVVCAETERCVNINFDNE